MRISVLCPSNIARRRFMPALELVDGVEFASIAYALPEEWVLASDGASDSEVWAQCEAQHEQAEEFVAEYGGKVVKGFGNLLESSDVDAVYIPLPPALHFPWAKRALEAGKHVLLEKPFTTSLADTQELIELAQAKCLAVHENYMFAFHSQINYVRDKIASGDLGEVRVIRVDFGFPFRGANDFRYSKALGGGALLDCGGYTLKLAAMLLGPSARVVASSLCSGRGLEVDLFGAATLQNEDGLCAQVSFGMDNDYRCNIDVWGSEASLTSNRILTAPAGFKPTMVIRRNGEEEVVELEADDSFKKSIEHFVASVEGDGLRFGAFEGITHQAKLVEETCRQNGAV